MRSTHPARTVLGCAAIALVLATCGGGDGQDTAGSSAPASESDGATGGGGAADYGTGGDEGTGATASGDDSAADDATVVTVADISFQEPSTTVQAGEEVTWENQDDVGHTVTAGTPDEQGDAFDEELPGSGTVSVSIDEPGSYPYFCRIHPSMTAELVVEG